MRQNQKLYFFYLIMFFSILISSFCCRSVIYASTQAEDAWFLDDIDARNAWDFLAGSQSDTSSPVIVAVIDTGCDYSHPLIQNSLWINSAELNGISGEDDDHNGYVDDIYGIDTYNHDSDPMDDSGSTIRGHGTHVAGCILQTAGVTETTNPFGIQLMCIKAGDAYGNFHSEDVAEALHYAVDNGAAVINLSISSRTTSPILQEALEYAAQSAILVSSSGNYGIPTSDSGYTSCGDYYPAAYPFVAGVMSYGKTHQLSAFSNWDFSAGHSPEYEIAAPGEAILSCTYGSSQKTMSGTSMSAGIVSGCAALLTAKYGSGGIYSAKDLTAHLMASGNEDVTFTDLYGKNYSFRSINLLQLLSDTPKPNLALTDYSVSKSDSAPDAYELHYVVSNQGCTAKNIKIDISADTPEVVLHTGSEPAETLSALSNATGSCSISLPDNNELSSIQLSIRISYENGSNISDTQTFSYEKRLSITTENTPSCSEIQIPLQGITISASPQLVIKAGSSLQLTVSYIPENTTDDRTLTFQSSQPSTADVDENGRIWAKKSGTAAITAISSKGHTRQITVLVYEENSITITPPAHPDNPIPPSSPTNSDSSVNTSPSGSPSIQDKTDTILTPPEVPDSKNETFHGVQKGKIYTVDGMKYKITNASTNGRGTVSLIGTTKKKASLSSLTVKKTVRIKGACFRITAIGKAAFAKCKNLKTVKISNYVQTIGTASFSKCTSLKSLTIGSGVVKISPRAFDGCRKLKKITVKSKKVKSIGKNAFRNISPKAKFYATRSFLTRLSKYQ